MTSKSLYTNTLPKDMAATVRAIPAPEGCDTFQSHPTSYDEGKSQWSQWVEAWKDPKTGLWTLETHQRFSGEGESATRRQKTIAQNVSFFDALHYCAYEEVSRKAGAARITGDVDDGLHYVQIAANASQPLDAQGLPHPAAHGRILTDGIFDDEAYVTARNTRGITLNEKANAAAPSLVDFENLGVGDVANENAVTLAKSKMVRKQGLIRKFETALDAADEFKKVKANRRDEHYAKDTLRAITPTIMDWKEDYVRFVHGFGYGLMSIGVLSCGGIALMEGYSAGLVASTVIPAVAMYGWAVTASIAAVPSVFMGTRSKVRELMASSNLTSRVAMLPDSKLKSDIQTYRKMIKASDHFAKASNIVSEHGNDSKWHLHRAFRHVNKGARIAGMIKLQTDQLRMALIEGKFPSAYDINRKLEETRRELGGQFRQISEQIRQSDDVPELEHKEEVPVDFMTAKTKSYTP